MPRRFFLLSKNIWLALLGGAAGLALVCFLGAASFFVRAMPSYAGSVEMKGLAAPVHVMFDAHAVPHIFADSDADAARALGYVHASERLFQMEMQRRAGAGRLSEFAGPATLPADKLARTLGLYALAESSFEALSTEGKAFLTAYAEGVNDWLAQNRSRLPPEFLLLKIEPDAWRPADTLVWGKLMSLQLSKNLEFEKMRARLAARLPRERWRALFPPQGDAPVTTAPLKIGGGIEEAQNILGSITGLDHGASNAWAVSGARTVSGKPLLANDPHLGLEAPILWYLARLVTPDNDLKGATVPGLPIVLLGQNSAIAWGITSTGGDVQDLFMETVDSEDSNAYRVPGGKRPFIARTEIIRVRGGEDAILNVRSTRHGPVLSDIDPELAALAGEGKVAALSFTGLHGRDTTAEALWRLNHASSWETFLAALRYYQTPIQNFFYADKEGNIGFIAPGAVPVRKAGDGAAPADGATGAQDWVGMIPFTLLPQVYNPPAGYVFNANNPVVGLSYPYKIGRDWEESYRAERIQQFFKAPEKMDSDSAARMQADHLSLAARQLLPFLLEVRTKEPRAIEALALLRNWDGVMDKDRPEPLIFDAWLWKMSDLLFAQGLGDPLTAKGPFKASLITTFLQGRKGMRCSEDDGTVCADLVLKAFKEALDDLEKRRGGKMASWRWGEEHQARLTHKLYSRIPVLRNLTDLSAPSSGDFYTLDRGNGFEMKEPHPFARIHGGGFRGIYDLDDSSQSRFMIATGQSGHVFSRHYGDLAPLWNEVKSITLSGSREQLLRQGAKELTFLPAQ